MNFEDLVFLFTSDNRNRGLIRMNFDEAACLWKAIKATEGNILEIGRRHGGSTILLLAASGEGRKVISVDINPAHHSIADSFFNEPSNSKRLELIVADSTKLNIQNVGLVFIDGDHTYEGVTGDIQAHWNNIHSEKGLAVFHDAIPNDGLSYNNEINHCPGVTKACADLQSGGYAEFFSSSGSVLVLRKIKDIPHNFFNLSI